MNEWMFSLAPVFAVLSVLLWILVIVAVISVAWRWMRAHERMAQSLSDIAAALQERPPR